MPIRMTGMVSGLDTDTLIKDLVSAQKMKNKKVEDNQTLLTWKQEKWKDLNTKLYKLYMDDIGKMRLQGNYQAKKTSTSNDNLVSVIANTNAPEGTHTLKINKLARSQFVTGGKIIADKDGNSINASAVTKLTDLGIEEGSTISIGKEGNLHTISVTAETTIADFVDTAKDAGLNASFDLSQERLFLSSKESGEENSFQITATNSVGDEDNSLLNNIGLDALNLDGAKVDMTSTVSTVVSSSNSEVIYNGAILEGSSNVITVNGLTITLKGADESQTINLNVAKDTQATYDMVKSFIKSYSEVLEEMNNLFYADSARDYAPLSDEEREAMTDDQIEKWETKIKDSILRRDTTLGSVLDTMRNSMMSTVEVDGKRYSLANYGIRTSTDYMERGLLHINGNEDDADFSTEEDKLMKALEEDADTVIEVLAGISKKLYDGMYEKMKSIPNVRTAFTFYNDKTMIEQQRQYGKEIQKMESDLIRLEDRYYKQFSAMETALSKIQSQNNMLLGMLGMNNQQQ